MPASNLAEQIAGTDARIADVELQIVQLQKRVENLLAKGVDPNEPRSAIVVLQETLAYLGAHKTRLEDQVRAGCQG